MFIFIPEYFFGFILKKIFIGVIWLFQRHLLRVIIAFTFILLLNVFVSHGQIM